MIKYNKILFILSFIVVMITINVFTFTAVALEGKNNGLTPIETIDTKDLIEINLYDYGTNINYNNKNGDYGTFYPGFTQSGGYEGGLMEFSALLMTSSKLIRREGTERWGIVSKSSYEFKVGSRECQ